jgi:hypothetical protein
MRLSVVLIEMNMPKPYPLLFTRTQLATKTIPDNGLLIKKLIEERNKPVKWNSFIIKKVNNPASVPDIHKLPGHDGPCEVYVVDRGIIGVFMTCDCLKVSFDIKGIFKVYRRNSQIQTPLSDIQPNPEKKEKNNPTYRSLLAKRSKGKDRRW